jgi:hypothetical protein
MSDSTSTPSVENLEGNPDELLLAKLQQIALTPVTIRGIFLLLTRLHWSDPNFYGSAKSRLGTLYWAKEEKERTLLVDYDYNFDPARSDKRPAIYVGTADFDFRRAVIDNRHSQTEDRAGEQYAMLGGTNVIIRHIGSTPDESLAMADLTGQFFLGMRKLIQESLKVHSFEVVKIAASKPFERAPQAADQQFMVDLILNLQYNAVWLIWREGHRIKTVTYKQSLDELTA